MSAAGVYGVRTLNDNWYEDRHQPVENLTATGGFVNRKARVPETDIAYIGDRYDVLSRLSRMPPRESFATPDDGFREKQCTSKADYAPPKSRTEFVSKPPEKPRLVTGETVPELSFEDRRPVPGEQRGFGSVLNRHEENHEARYWNTSTGDFFGNTSKKGTLRREPHMIEHGCGVTTHMMETRNEANGMKCGSLCGEFHNNSNDPAINTATQRAWLYSKDVALTNVHLGGSRPVICKTDNELNLPLGTGAMGKIRADLAERKGKLFKQATYITTGLDKKPGVAIFKDHPGDNQPNY